jgi:hypothetical protein
LNYFDKAAILTENLGPGHKLATLIPTDAGSTLTLYLAESGVDQIDTRLQLAASMSHVFQNMSSKLAGHRKLLFWCKTALPINRLHPRIYWIELSNQSTAESGTRQAHHKYPSSPTSECLAKHAITVERWIVG